ncbi:MAG: hypothetical protein QM589_12555 [Thermomicrobiales bacterium]
MQPTTSRLTPDASHRGIDIDHGRSDWLRASVIAGFLATFAMTVCIAVAYGLANSIGKADGNSLERWLFALSNNRLTEHVGDSFFLAMFGNLIMGVVWAAVYARVVEPRLAGPGWWKGALFSLVPFVLTIAVFFPLAGVGLFARDVHAGPLPVGGALALHLIYGVLLGTFYAIDVTSGLSDARGEREAAESAERGAAYGIGIGTLLGFVAGWLMGPQMESLASRPIIGIAGALSGAAMGILLGSLLGMQADEHDQDGTGR